MEHPVPKGGETEKSSLKTPDPRISCYFMPLSPPHSVGIILIIYK